MEKLEKFDVWEHFSERESWTCNECGEEIECNESKLRFHMESKHGVKFEEDEL